MVQLPTGTLPGSNTGQDVHTHVPLSSSSMIWYRGYTARMAVYGRGVVLRPYSRVVFALIADSGSLKRR